MAVLTDMVSDIKDRLAVLNVTAGGYVQAIESAPGAVDSANWTPDAMQALLDIVNTRFPAIVVAIDEIRGFEGTSGGYEHEWIAQAQVTVYVISDHLRDTVEGRLDQSVEASADATQDQGLRALWEDTFTLLAAYTPTNAAGPMQPQQMRTTMVSPGFTVIEQRYEAKMSITSSPLATPTLITTYEIDISDAPSTTPILTQDQP